MTLFKKKKQPPAILYTIDKKIKEEQEKGNRSFYYALTDNELLKVRAHLISKYHAIAEPDHKTDNTIVYKIYGYPM